MDEDKVAAAWEKYLKETKELRPDIYEDQEPEAWARLRRRLRAIENKRAAVPA